MIRAYYNHEQGFKTGIGSNKVNYVILNTSSNTHQ